MANIAPTFFVQLVEDNDWLTVYTTADRQQAHALLFLLVDGDEDGGRVVTKRWLHKREGVAALRQAESDIEQRTPEDLAWIEPLAETAKEEAEDALLRVANAKRSLAQAEEYFHGTISRAYNYNYSLRDIAAVAGFSQTRIHQILDQEYDREVA